MKKDRVNQLRHVSRKLIRELGMLHLNEAQKTPPHWHALIEISKESDITISKLGRILLLSTSAMSRIVNELTKHGFVIFKEGLDRREKYMSLTEKGLLELEAIDEFSNSKIKRAFALLTEEDQQRIIDAIGQYGEVLEASRTLCEQVKIFTLSTSRHVRKQIINMIETIQRDEFLLPITNELNACVLKLEEEFYYNNSYNFWYATDNKGNVIGSIGLKQLNTHQAEIKKFFVNQEYRSKGVAQKLLKTLLKSASKHQFEELYLGTVDKLKAAAHFYEKNEFSRIPEHQLPQGFIKCPLDTVFFKRKTQI